MPPSSGAETNGRGVCLGSLSEMTPPSSPPVSSPPVSANAALRLALDAHRSELARMLDEGHDGIALGRANARFLNGLFVERFRAAAAQAGKGAAGIALAAVGSFGRGAVALRSDADVVLVVAPSVSADDAAKFAEALLYPLWDATLVLGHQVLGLADSLALARDDLPT